MSSITARPCRDITIDAMNIQRTDSQLLNDLPDFIAVGGLLKAMPSESEGRRFLYFEASNEDVDHQNEIVLQKALSASSDYYLRHGNIDLSHYTIMGAKSGMANFMEFEIGKPIDVQVNGTKTFVKAELYTGESPMAKNANMVWDSLTKQNPPSRWYPSVGGAVISKSVQIDPSTGQKVAVVDNVRWNNIALDRCPVNKTVPEVSAAPVGIFAKSLNGFVMKSLEASYGTDSATLEGGGALRTESLHGKPYRYYQELVAKGLRDKTIKPRKIKEFIQELGFSKPDAEQFNHQFLTDLNRRRSYK